MDRGYIPVPSRQVNEPFRHPQAPKLLLPLPTLPNALLSALSLGMSLPYKLSPSLAAPHPAGRDTVSLAPFQTHTNFFLETCPSLVQCGCGAQAILGSALPSQMLKGPRGSSGWTLLLTAQTSQGQALWCHLLGPGSGMKDARAGLVPVPVDLWPPHGYNQTQRKL